MTTAKENAHPRVGELWVYDDGTLRNHSYIVSNDGYCVEVESAQTSKHLYYHMSSIRSWLADGRFRKVGS